MALKSMTWYSLPLLALLIMLPTLARADAGAEVACLPTIRDICAGLEDHLEACLAQRGDQLSVICHSVLLNAIAQAQQGTGMGACVEDVKRLCQGITADALTQCMTEKYAQFSPACQKQMDHSSAPPP